MEKHIVESFSDKYLDIASELYEFNKNTLNKIDGFENLIYSFEKNASKYILRVSHHDHKSADEIIAELEFIDYLSINDAKAVTPIFSVNKKLVEELEPCGFIISCFEFASGRRPAKDDVNEEFLKEYGRVIARMHVLAKTYKPLKRRAEWDDDKLFEIAHKYLPEESKGLIRSFEILKERLSNYPKDKDSYGLIHTDMHMGNFFISDDNEFEVFDFDDSAYKWFVSDIAIVLFYVIWFDPDNYDRTDFIMKHFMSGYREINKLSDFWFEKFDEFLKLRRLVLALVIYRSFDMNDAPEWVTKFYELHLDKTLNDEPMLNTDFTVYNHDNGWFP